MAGKKWPGALVIFSCLLTLACQEDPARSVKIIQRPEQPTNPVTESPTASVAAPATPPAAVAAAASTDAPAPTTTRPPALSRAAAALPAAPAAGAVVTSSRVVVPNWRPEFCPPPDEDLPGQGSLTASGPCPFQQQEAVSCEALQDDFYVAVTRKALLGATLVLYFNVENYRGPGAYKETQMLMAVQNDKTIYRWSNDYARVTVGPGETYVDLPETRLDGEPVLFDCSRLIEPASNYQYQCAGRGSAMAAIGATAEILSGRLQCGKARHR